MYYKVEHGDTCEKDCGLNGYCRNTQNRVYCQAGHHPDGKKDGDVEVGACTEKVDSWRLTFSIP